MKKLMLVGVLAGAMMFSLCACGESTDTAAPTGNQTESQEAVEEAATAPETGTGVERDLPKGNYEEVGEGTFYLTGESGTTENGDEIVLYPDMDTFPHAHIGVELWDMDGSVQTFIYVDGVELDKQQVGAGYQGFIDFYDEQAWAITEGEHIVEAVQYVDNDPANEMAFYRSETYTVKVN